VQTSQSIVHLEAVSAKRAFGAMIFSFFGAVLLEIWNFRARAGTATYIVIAALGLALIAGAFLRYRRYAPSLALEPETPAKQKADRVFNIVNVGQWVLILILGNVLANIGLKEWVVPMGIIVIGLHFVPLAYVFRNPSHYFLAAALVGFALVYPLLASAGPGDPVGFLGTGIILWLGALVALRNSAKATQ
jgi:hypothetical protein